MCRITEYQERQMPTRRIGNYNNTLRGTSEQDGGWYGSMFAVKVERDERREVSSSIVSSYNRWWLVSLGCLYASFVFCFPLTTVRNKQPQPHLRDSAIPRFHVSLAFRWTESNICPGMATFIRRARFPIRRRYSEFLTLTNRDYTDYIS